MIKNVDGLMAAIRAFGFLPLFKNCVPRFSVAEMTLPGSWWSGNPDEDPWVWREIVAARDDAAYGKVFLGKAGFVSREWYPLFASYRRDGYDFDSRYEDGLANRKCKKVMDALLRVQRLPSHRLKELAGFSADGEKGFDGTVSQLQMQTYITIRGFERKRNKRGAEYGWPVGVYATPEDLFGEEYVRSKYSVSASDARNIILSHLSGLLPDASGDALSRLLG